MTDDFISIKEMILACGFNSRKKIRENYITPALEDDSIERKLPNQPNHPFSNID